MTEQHKASSSVVAAATTVLKQQCWPAIREHEQGSSNLRNWLVPQAARKALDTGDEFAHL
jgi:hypothetical protein